MMRITAFYASLLTVLYLYLSVRVIGWRRLKRVEIRHAEDAQLLRRMRVHANFAEYAPFALLLMALAESLAPPHILIHLVGLTLVAGRVMHANPEVQSVGMQLTLAAMGIAALMCFSLSALYLLV